MNDLNFGATLLSLFLALVGTIVIELMPAPPAPTAAAATRPAPPHEQTLAQADTTGCVIVARSRGAY